MACYGKIRKNPDLPAGQSYEISHIDKGFLFNQLGLLIIAYLFTLQIINTIPTLAKDRSLPRLTVNNTNKFIKIYRHVLLANISGIQNKVASVNSVIQNKTCET